MRIIHRRLLTIGLSALALLLIAKCAVLALTWNEPINQFRRSLADRDEKRSESDEFGDHSLRISGRLAAARFSEIAELLGLVGKLKGGPKPLGGWQEVVGETGWKLPESFDEQYHDEAQGYSVLLGRSGDRVFYQYLSW